MTCLVQIFIYTTVNSKIKKKLKILYLPTLKQEYICIGNRFIFILGLVRKSSMIIVNKLYRNSCKCLTHLWVVRKSSCFLWPSQPDELSRPDRRARSHCSRRPFPRGVATDDLRHSPTPWPARLCRDQGHV